MRFASPSWLWLLLALPVFLGAMVLEEKERLKKFELFAHRILWNQLAPNWDSQARMRKGMIFLAAVGLVVLSLARPQFGSKEETIRVSGLDLVVLLDVSNSMNVEDIVPSRLDKAKHLVRSLVGRLGGDRVGIIAFAGSSFVACPLTSDLEYVLDTLDIVGSSSIQNQGTNIGLGLETAYRALEGGAEIATEPPKTDSAPQGREKAMPSKAVILISDGEDQESEALAAATKIKDSGAQFFALGVGTEKGGPIPIKDPQGNTLGFKRDKAGQPIISSFRSAFLEKLASKSGGIYMSVSPEESEVDAILSDLGALNRGDYTERRYLVYEERFQIPLLLAVVLLFVEISLSSRKKRLKAAPSSLLAVIVALLFSSTSVLAGKLKVTPPSLDTYLENKKGLEAFQGGNLEEAQRNFGAAQARNPGLPEPEFNQGVVSLQKQDFAKAAESFANAVESARASKNLSLLGKSLYNLGNALAKNGDTKGAVKSYLDAIQTAEESRDSNLGDEARRNLQLMMKEQQKQKESKSSQKPKESESKSSEKQEQSQDKSLGKPKDEKKSGEKQDQRDQEKQGDKSEKDKAEKDRAQKDKKDQKGDSDQKPDRQKNESKNDSGQDEKPEGYQDRSRPKPFESKKLSPEDAQRVMSELNSREKALQEKLQNKHARQSPSANSNKDW